MIASSGFAGARGAASAARSTIAAIVLAAVVAGCGASKAEIRRARTSAYDADFAIVYSEALAAVRSLYPDLEEDPAHGVISTVWHQVHFTSNQDSREEEEAGQDAPRGTGLAGRQPRAVKRTFVRFDVTVAGSRPFRVRVRGKASQWDAGDAKPTDLTGAAKPAWLPGRIDALTVAIYKRLKPYAVKVEEEEAIVEELGPTVDKTMFGDIPAEAAEVAAEIVLAIDTRAAGKIREHLADDVIWSLGAPGDADTALAMWQADPAALDALEAALSSGCVAEGDVVTCPRAAVEQPGYVDWRLTLELRDGAWKVTSFVTGD